MTKNNIAKSAYKYQAKGGVDFKRCFEILRAASQPAVAINQFTQLKKIIKNQCETLPDIVNNVINNFENRKRYFISRTKKLH